MTEAQVAACVLYEDNHLLVVCKPPNVPVQADASGDEDLLTALKAYLKRKYGKPGEVYLGLVHRLDRPVGGAMVFARTSKAAARLTDQVRTRQMGRTYLAVVRGDPPGSGALRDFLLKDERTNTSRAVPEGTPGAKEARLTYRVLARREGRSILFSTHITSDLEKCADDITYIKNGTVLASADKDSFYRSFQHLLAPGESGPLTLEEIMVRTERRGYHDL